jgi:YidC/Oxa1 family membrane protein insertase
MDRTSRIGVLVCIALLVYLAFTSKPTPPKLPPAPTAPVATTTPAAIAPVTAAPPSAAAPTTAAATAPMPETISVLENDSIKATFTSLGAAIREVEMKRRKGDKASRVVLNENAHSNILQLSGWPGADAAGFAVRQDGENLTYTATLPNGVTWVRTYTLGAGYALKVTDALSNPGAGEITLPSYGLSVGRAEPLRVAGHYQNTSLANMYLGCGWLTSNAYHLVTIGNFSPGYVPLVGIKTSSAKDVIASSTIDALPIRWVGAENQFFAVLLTPAEDHLIDNARFQCFNIRDANGAIVPPDAEPDIEAAAFFPEVKLPPGGTVSLAYDLYAGPKDFDRLNALGEQQGELMNYGHFELLIVPMLWVLHKFHAVVGNYGVAIILLTLCIKIITWPLQSFANRSGKRMQAVAPKIKELQAKYKDQPEKLNTETFALYKEYGVNPFGGCLPALVQMPVFFSLYYMLQNAGELRGQTFLWVRDLTQADTVYSHALPFVIPLLNISHLTINPLPIMVTALMAVMMRMTPQIGDPNQAKIAQFMPLIFLFIFYNFAAALSLYYVINNCVSIVQIYRNLRKPLPELKRVPKKKT